MFEALADPILPIFAVVAVGFAFRRASIFEVEHVSAINRFVFYLSAPALVFIIFARAPLGDLNLPVIFSYFAAEVFIYGGVALIARKIFGLPLAESFLLGMAAIFSNHVFFVRPIAVLAYGEQVSLPIGGIIIVDVICFCLTVFIVDAAVSSGGGFRRAVKGLLRNPFVWAPVFGGLAYWAADLVPSGILTFADFAGTAAAPVSLFALGIVLGGLNARPIGLLVMIVAGAKLVLHPLLVFAGISVLGDEQGWGDIAILIAAGPCGAMPFVIAVRYGVQIERIAKAMLISTVLSVFSLSMLI